MSSINKVFSVYRGYSCVLDESPTHIRTFDSREKAEAFIQNIENYEASNPRPVFPSIDNDNDEEWEMFFKAIKKWEKDHPIGDCVTDGGEFYISEHEVF